jgi:hypothetical protein
MNAIEQLKASAPSDGERKTRLGQCHSSLITALEGRIEVVDAELAVSLVLHFRSHFG